MADEQEEWHGWVHEDRAVYLTPTPDGEHVGLYLQQGRDTQLAAVFLDPVMASMVMGWMDDALLVTAQANTELLRRLETEQPLLFAPRSQPASEPGFDGEVEPLDDDDD